MVDRLQEMVFRKLIKGKYNCLNGHNNGGSYIGCSIIISNCVYPS
uniref:Uncharacterized protein n=1 Tax=Lepeophtheirus salmonis TaxID=72036 RepID=A0A0K2UA91_LEPSM